MIKYYPYIRYSANFRTKQSGNYNDYNTWEIEGADGNWYNSPYYPEAGNFFTIQVGHEVTLTRDENCLRYENNGTLTTNGYNLFVNDFDEDAETLFSAMSVEPPNEVKNSLNNLIIGLKDDVSLTGSTSNWDELDALWVWWIHDRQAAYLNIKNPAANTITDGVQPSFIPYQGLQGDGGSQYIDLNFNPTTHGVNFTQNSASLFVWSEINSQSTGVAIGAYNATNSGIRLSIRGTTNFIQAALNSNAVNATTQTDCEGLTYVRRVNSTDLIVGKTDGTEVTVAAASLTPININLYALALNNIGVVATWDNRLYSAMGLGSGNVDYSKIKTRLQ